jgi:hypothetical protein
METSRTFEIPSPALADRPPEGEKPKHQRGRAGTLNGVIRDALRYFSLDFLSLSNLRRDLPSYAGTVKEIVRHPVAFPRRLRLDDAREFKRSVAHYKIGLFFTFLALVPVSIHNSQQLTKIDFFVGQLFLYGMGVAVLHLALNLFGARHMKFRGTFTIYSYFAGTLTPLMVLLSSPYYWTTGHIDLFPTVQQLGAQQGSAIAPWLAIYVVIAFTIVGWAALIIEVRWFTQSHRIGWVRVTLALAMAAIVTITTEILVLDRFLGAIFNRINGIPLV